MEQQTIAERQEEELAKLQQTNADTTAVCCLCESSVPTTFFSFAFCESCNRITRFCNIFHVRGPQARIASYYKWVPFRGNSEQEPVHSVPGRCIVCVKSICTKIQRRGEYQEYCCRRCHYQSKFEVIVGRDEESSDPAEESDEFSRRKLQDSEDFYGRRYWHRDGLGCWCGPTTHQPIGFGSASSTCESTWKQT